MKYGAQTHQSALPRNVQTSAKHRDLAMKMPTILDLDAYARKAIIEVMMKKETAFPPKNAVSKNKNKLKLFV
jgi:hypothetical protein